MNKITTSILLFLIACAAQGSESPFIKTDLIPSNALLKVVGVEKYEITKNIIVNIGSGSTKATAAKVGFCELPGVVPLKSLAHKSIKGITKIKAAAESGYYKKQKLLFTLVNEGGLSEFNGFVSARINLKEYNPGSANIWVFFYTNQKVYANASHVKCTVVH